MAHLEYRAPQRALDGIKVIEIAGEAGHYCGKLFADMGAEVVLIEPLQGCAGRFQAPFFDDDQRHSIAFFYLNAGKQSVSLDLATTAGQAKFARLVGSADLLIAPMIPEEAARMGLSPATLAAINPRLVYLSITPFGVDGPLAKAAADDLTLAALGGMLHMGGYADGSPQVMYGDQAYKAAASFGAVAAMAALLAAEQDGMGEFIDVSIQESILLGLENAAQYYDLEGVVRPRGGGFLQGAAGQLQCKDGYVYLMAGGVSGRKAWASTIEWLNAIGAPGADALHDAKWQDGEFRSTPEARQAFHAIFSVYSRSRTKAEVCSSAKPWRIPIAPVATPHEVLASEQLSFRDFFVELWHDQLGVAVRAPGPPYQMSATPARASCGAPALGEGNAMLLKGAA